LRIIKIFVGFSLVFVFFGTFILGAFLWQTAASLPDYRHLADYAPPVTSRAHAGDGELIAEFARERRLFVPIDVIPTRLRLAFLAAEDKNFYDHSGLDFFGIVRAAVQNVFNVMNNRRLEGASTITQQVAKNFLLTSDVTFRRKIKEAILAVRLERTFTKPQLLELYLNEIYLGIGSYGVAAAALNYFDKSLDELNYAEAAYLAALPKGPNNYHPIRHKERGLARRNWVLDRMYENGYIDKTVADFAKQQDLQVSFRPFGSQLFEAEYFVEEVRRQVYDRYGENQLYGGGLSIRTTLNTKFQAHAMESLRDGLVAYDRKRGYRGPIAQFEDLETWQEQLMKLPYKKDLSPWRLAVVLSVDDFEAEIGLRPDSKNYKRVQANTRAASADDTRVVPSGEIGKISLEQAKWARRAADEIDGPLGPRVQTLHQVLGAGDVIYVARMPSADGKRQVSDKGLETGDVMQPEAEQIAADGVFDDPIDPPRVIHNYTLEQLPEVNGGMIAMDPHTGRVLAMAGGFSFGMSEFNRAVQAQRQPGSAFKPFVYAAALDDGYTPASLVLDAPFVMDQGNDQGLWKPENYARRFYGLSTLRLGMERSRNLMTIRLAQQIGMKKVVDYAEKFGVVSNLPPVLSMSLGAGETSLIRMASAYSMFVNGGKRIQPVLIDRIQDRYGKTIFRQDQRECAGCASDLWEYQVAPSLPDTREEAVSPQTAYQIVSMLEGVMLRGTGRSSRIKGKTLAGKTGTTNDSRDAWFIGFSPDLVVGVYIGFDDNRSLGRRQSGSGVAAPIFKSFMSQALENQPSIPFRIPPAVNLVRISAKSGRLAKSTDRDVILEAFKVGTEPSSRNRQRVIGGNTSSSTSSPRRGEDPREAASGLY
jgi:penicillin-binding protein 1A